MVEAADRRLKRVVFRRRVVVVVVVMVMVGLRPQRQRGHVEDSFFSLLLAFFFSIWIPLSFAFSPPYILHFIPFFLPSSSLFFFIFFFLPPFFCFSLPRFFFFFFILFGSFLPLKHGEGIMLCGDTMSPTIYIFIFFIFYLFLIFLIF